jgi:hypothetical protein
VGGVACAVPRFPSSLRLSLRRLPRRCQVDRQDLRLPILSIRNSGSLTSVKGALECVRVLLIACGRLVNTYYPISPIRLCSKLFVICMFRRRRLLSDISPRRTGLQQSCRFDSRSFRFNTLLLSSFFNGCLQWNMLRHSITARRYVGTERILRINACFIHSIVTLAVYLFRTFSMLHVYLMLHVDCSLHAAYSSYFLLLGGRTCRRTMNFKR